MCPPGVDQTTRSPQQWSILAPCKQQRMPLPGLEKGIWHPQTPTGYLNSESDFGAVALLLNSPSTPLDIDTVIPSRLARPSASSAIEGLPAELLIAIFEDLSLEPAETLAIALCSQTLWLQAVRYIHTSYAKSKHSWVGTPLACVGSYLTALPPGFQDVLPVVVQKQRTFGGYGTSPVRKWQHGARHAYDDITEFATAQCWLDCFDAYTDSVAIEKSVLRQLRMTLRDQLLQVPSYSIYGDREWVLRNLSKKQFARLTRSAHHVEAGPGQSPALCVSGSLPELSVDKALVLRTCCGDFSDYSAGGDPGSEVLRCGAWAGDSFDVVPAIDVDVSEGWTDATKAMLKRWDAVKPKIRKDCRRSSCLRAK